MDTKELAVVTGASSGIGEAAARRLAAENYRVVLVARSQQKLASIAADIGPDAMASPCDAANGDEVLAMAARVTTECGVPKVIVNCAGAGQWKWIEDTTPAEAVAMMQAPYFAAFNLSHAFMRGMLRERRGTLIHINSPAALLPWPSCTGYAAARWALRGLHEALCQDLAGTGVRSCHIVFGEVASPYFEHNPGSHEKLPGIGRMVRTLTPAECAQVIADVARNPRREVIHPPMMRAIAACQKVMPEVVSWLVRRTGTRRPTELARGM